MQLSLSFLALALSVAPVFVSAELVYPRRLPAPVGKRQDPKDSLQLDERLVQEATKRTGQEGTPTDGQVESLTSNNNLCVLISYFRHSRANCGSYSINYCLEFDDPLTNGEQVLSGSCNGIVMGRIPAKNKMASSIVRFPKNGDVIDEKTDITFQVAVRGMQTGAFTNALLTYYSAPQQLNGNGEIIGHNHITVQKINGLDDVEPQDPAVFAFFKGLNEPANNGVLSATAVGGLEAGFYRACTIITGANHLAIIQPVAQRGAENDCQRVSLQGFAM